MMRGRRIARQPVPGSGAVRAGFRGRQSEHISTGDRAHGVGFWWLSGFDAVAGRRAYPLFGATATRENRRPVAAVEVDENLRCSDPGYLRVEQHSARHPFVGVSLIRRCELVQSPSTSVGATRPGGGSRAGGIPGSRGCPSRQACSAEDYGKASDSISPLGSPFLDATPCIDRKSINQCCATRWAHAPDSPGRNDVANISRSSDRRFFAGQSVEFRWLAGPTPTDPKKRGYRSVTQSSLNGRG